MAHTHYIRDDDKRFVIDIATRVVTIPEGGKPLLTQYDHNSEYITFECGRYTEGHDLAISTKVRVHYNDIARSGGKTSKGLYEANDLQADPNDQSKVVFTWPVSRMATMYAGTLAFVVEFSCLDGTDVVYSWHTHINKELTVDDGINNTKVVESMYADVLEIWKQSLFGIGDTEEASMKSVAQAQQNAIETKGNRVLASIPDEYEELQAKVDSLTEDEYIPTTDMADNTITETFDDGRTKVTIIDGQTITENWYSTTGVLTKSKTIVINQNGVTETLTTV